MMPRCFLRLDSASTEDMLTDDGCARPLREGSGRTDHQGDRRLVARDAGQGQPTTTRHHLVLVVAARFAVDGARAALARLLEHLGPAPAESA
jgi:hypothetical protein